MSTTLTAVIGVVAVAALFAVLYWLQLRIPPDERDTDYDESNRYDE